MGLFNENENVTNIDSFECLDENNKPKEFDESVMDMVFILDKSGSMSGAVEYTIDGFNSYIEKEKGSDENILVTLILFDTEYEVLYSRKPIEDVEKLTREEYDPWGFTALYDAIGRTIVSLENEVNNKVLFVITTDGLENSSVEFTESQIKGLIERSDWEFLFIGANIDSYGEALTLGIDENHAANYEKSSAGLGSLFGSVRKYRISYSNDRDLDNSDWKDGLD